MGEPMIQVKQEPDSDSEIESLSSISVSSGSPPPYIKTEREDLYHVESSLVVEHPSSGKENTGKKDQSKVERINLEHEAVVTRNRQSLAVVGSEDSRSDETDEFPVELSTRKDTDLNEQRILPSEKPKEGLIRSKHMNILQVDKEGDHPTTSSEDASDACEWDYHVYRCVQCGMAFRQQAHLVRHLKVHNFPCKTCGAEFSSDAALLEHEDSHKEHVDGDKQEQKHSCKECQIDFKTKRELSHHWSKHIFGCDFCDRTFLSQSNLMDHEKGHVMEKVSCETCGQEFQRLSNLKVHKQKYCQASPKKNEQPSTKGSMSQDHHERQEPSENDESNSSQNLFEKLQSNQSPSVGLMEDDSDDIVIVERSRSGYFNCPKCPKAFTVKEDYEKHLKSHLALGDILRKGFLNAVKVKQEQERENVSTDLYKCTECNVVFSTSAELKRHHDRHMYPCESCSKTFTSVKKLKSHMLLHTGKEVFECQTCGKIYARFKDYEKHMDQHGQGQKILDGGGSASASNSPKVDRSSKHVPEANAKKRMFASLGNKTLFCQNTMTESAHKNSEHFCKICQKEYSRLGDLKRHIIQKHNTDDVPTSEDPIPDDNKPFECTHCNNLFGYLFNFTRHINVKHSDMEIKDNQGPGDAGENKFLCKRCKTEFVNLVSYNKHFATRHASEGRLFHCNKCKKIFMGLSEFTVHLEKHYSLLRIDTKEQFDCNMCQRSFLTKIDLNTHFRRSHSQGDVNIKDHEGHASSLEKKFPCMMCDRSFSRSEGLKEHLRISHLGQKPVKVDPDDSGKAIQRFVCKECKKAFTHHEDLIKHMQQHHPSKKDSTDVESIEKDEKLLCEKCHKNFSRQSDLTRHLRHSHPGEETDSSDVSAPEEEDLKCHMCEKTFNRKSDLTSHVRHYCPSKKKYIDVDSDDASSGTAEVFSCKKCGKTYKRQGDLTRHIRHIQCTEEEQGTDGEPQNSDSESEQFSCKKCQQNFSRQSDLTRHNNRCHSMKKPRSETDVEYVSSEESQSEREEFSCKKCNTTYSAQSYLNRHNNMYHSKKDLNSDISSSEDSDTDSENEEFACKKCKKIFSRQGDLTKHNNRYHPKKEPITDAESESEEELSCKKCQKTFSRQGDLTKHNNRYHPKEESSDTGSDSSVSAEECNDTDSDFSCRKCKKTFTERRFLTRHNHKVHPHDAPFSCKKCNRGFSRKSSLLTHQTRYHLETNSKSETESDCSSSVNGQFLCSKCDRTFMKQADLSKHMLRRHPQKGESSGWDQTFMKKSDHSKHVLHQHLLKEKHQDIQSGRQFRCQVCKETFADQNEFALHVLQHSREENVPFKDESIGSFDCTKGQRSFLQEPKLQPHLLVSHAKEGVSRQAGTSHADISAENHLCRICAKDFPTRKKLKNHFYSCHRGEPSELPASDGLFHCKECDKSFTKFGKLQLHMKCHPAIADTSVEQSAAAKQKRARQLSEESGSDVQAKRIKVTTTPVGSSRNTGTASHIEITKPSGAALSCCECGKCFANRSELKKHEDTHVFMCKFCSRFFTTTKSLQEHKLIHHKTTDGSQKCHECGSCFRTNEQLSAHKQKGTCRVINLSQGSNSNTVRPVYDCELCGEVFLNEKELDEHQEYHTLGEFSQSKKEADWKDTIVRQRTLMVQRKREVIEELYLCRFCDETFLSLELVHRHERSHTGGQ